MTNLGLWEPQRFYDADDPLDLIITPESMAYTSTQNMEITEATNATPIV